MSAVMHDSFKQKSQADMTYEAQVRKERRFRTNVAISWFVLLVLIVYLFSGSNLLGFQTIELDREFIRENMSFIGGGLWETIRISVFSILLATVLALLAALGRLSTFPPIFAISTFYVSLIRGTPLYLQIFVFFLAPPQLGIVLSGIVAGVLALGLNYGAYMRMPLSRQELADMTGTTIETAIRIMSRWAKQDIVRTEKDGFVVLDRQALDSLALT